MITAKCRGMVIAINQREALLVASCYERWFHTYLRCVADGCWIQKSLGLVTPIAMSVPTTKIESHDSVFQPLTVINRKTTPVVLLRFWDDVVPFSGRYRDGICLTAAVAAMLLRPCRCAGSLALMNLHALRQFDGSAGDQFQSRRAWS